MKKRYRLALHIFRRDLRLDDNTALIEALRQADAVIPCFIFDTRQIDNNPYKSKRCIQFMSASLTDLQNQLTRKHGKLYYFHGIAEEIVGKLLEKLPIDAVFINRDYTPFSRKRDQAIEKQCHKRDIDFHTFSDALLHEPEQILKKDKQPYTVFTPAYRFAQTLTVNAPQSNNHTNYYNGSIHDANDQLINEYIETLPSSSSMLDGGRTEGLKLLKKISSLQHYKQERDYPALGATTHLSAHNKFGTISIREVYQAIVDSLNEPQALLSELHWRDFFTHIAFHFPHVFGNPFHTKYANLPWSSNESHWHAWQNGETGFPIVDAGMRELKATGYMHNRVRMITASFLVKDLHIDWRRGEKHFANHLVDYDPAVNNGNWQWAASTGCDAQPYFRIFNPWLQQQKFDADCLYIKKWIPELATVPAKAIHAWGQSQSITSYPAPIIDHSVASQRAKALYKKIAQQP